MINDQYSIFNRTQTRFVNDTQVDLFNLNSIESFHNYIVK